MKMSSKRASKYWATPSAFIPKSKRSIESVLKRATGVRKGRTSSSTLHEQVLYPEAEMIYLLVKEHTDLGLEEDLEQYVRRKLKEHQCG